MKQVNLNVLEFFVLYLIFVGGVLLGSRYSYF